MVAEVAGYGNGGMGWHDGEGGEGSGVVKDGFRKQVRFATCSHASWHGINNDGSLTLLQHGCPRV